MNKNQLKDVLSFFHDSEKLKSVLRHSWLSSGRQESDPEHSWRMGIMAMVFAPHLEDPVDLSRVLPMCMIHDIVEVYAGDYPAWNNKPVNKEELERESLRKLTQHLLPATAQYFHELWEEFEAGETNEAKFSIALDKLEVIMQHNEAPIDTWNKQEYEFNRVYGTEETNYDQLLRTFRRLLKEETDGKIEKEGKQ
ncbi:MAG TPA: HD domain-containing protein [Patescibacteria group bacterium]|nr:HD domain-containing protein [Patescibacteria group bacterium]